MPTNSTSAIQGQRFARMGCSLTTRGTYSSCRSSNAERGFPTLAPDAAAASVSAAAVRVGSILADGRSASRSGCDFVVAPARARCLGSARGAASVRGFAPVRAAGRKASRKAVASGRAATCEASADVSDVPRDPTRAASADVGGVPRDAKRWASVGAGGVPRADVRERSDDDVAGSLPEDVLERSNPSSLRADASAASISARESFTVSSLDDCDGSRGVGSTSIRSGAWMALGESFQTRGEFTVVCAAWAAKASVFFAASVLAACDSAMNSNANVSLSEASSSSITSRIERGRSEARFASIRITSLPSTGGICRVGTS